MVRKSWKLKLVAMFVLFSLPNFAFQKLTTTQMRENTIRINALELQETTMSLPKIKVVFDEVDLHFDLDKWNIKEQYIPQLQKLSDFIMANNYEVSIEGHTDSLGSTIYNEGLSLKRAESTKNTLLHLGLAVDRIVGISGKGEEQPIATNNTPEGRRQNRRIEFYLEKR